MGRKAHLADAGGRRQVEALAGYGIPEADIACVLAIDPKTLRKHYRDELDKGHIKANAAVAGFLYRKATTEGPQCVTAAIFWLKTRGQWKEAPQVHAVGSFDMDALTTEELRASLERDLHQLGYAPLQRIAPPAKVKGG